MKFNTLHTTAVIVLTAFLGGIFIASADVNIGDNLVTGLAQGCLYLLVSNLLIAGLKGLHFNVIEVVQEEKALGIFGGLYLLGLALSMAL